MGNNTKKDTVILIVLKQFSLKDALPRKQKPTDFYNPPSGKKNALTEQCQNDRSVLVWCTPIWDKMLPHITPP